MQIERERGDRAGLCPSPAELEMVGCREPGADYFGAGASSRDAPRPLFHGLEYLCLERRAALIESHPAVRTYGGFISEGPTSRSTLPRLLPRHFAFPEEEACDRYHPGSSCSIVG